MAKSKSNTTNEITYEQALLELQNLVDLLLSDQTSIDHLYEHVSRANFLVKYCHDKLRAIEGMVKEEVG